MKEGSDRPAIERPKVTVTECSTIVAHGQSKKLAEIRKRFQSAQPAEAVQPVKVAEVLPVTGLSPEIAAELGKARVIIDQRIKQITNNFPEGKKSRLFAIRFGSIDAVKAMSIKEAFKTLAIDEHAVNMKLLVELDFHGNQVSMR